MLLRVSGSITDFLYRDYGHYILESCLIYFAQESILDTAEFQMLKGKIPALQSGQLQKNRKDNECIMP